MTTTQRLLYEAKNRTSGLSDVKIDIYNASNTKVVDAATATEIGSTGLYVYEYTPVTSGVHVFSFDSATSPKFTEGTFLSDFPDVGSSGSDILYCSSSDVLRYLQPQITAFTTGTSPTLTEINDFIAGASDFLDTETNNSWRENTISEEYYDVPQCERWRYGSGLKIPLINRNIRPFDGNQGDKIEIWNGNAYVDWIDTKTEGRNNDFWIDTVQGDLYLKSFPVFRFRNGMRITYRWGLSTVPKDVRDAAAMLSAIEVLTMDDRVALLSDTSDDARMAYDSRIQRWQKKIDKTIHSHFEIVVV